MKISENFDIREFVPRNIFNTYGVNSTWFISEKVVQVAEFYKAFWTNYFQQKFPGKVESVSIVVNNWHYGGVKQFSGFRPPECTEGAKLSQHRFKSAFDCEIIINYTDGNKQEADYVEIHKVIQDNEALFLSKGITTVEDVSIASGWLHTDTRWIPNQTKILIVKPS
jgi:hypothetical protein